MPEETKTNGDLEHKVEHILIGKTKFTIGIITYTVLVVGFFFKIQLDVALIKQNHEAHMQTALEKIAILEKDETTLREQLAKQNEAIIRLLEMHGK